MHNISQEQKDLANYLKDVHLSLRRRTQEIGAEPAWREHLQNREILSKYAIAMKELSENFWSVNNTVNASTTLCRNDWMAKFIIDYYQNGGLDGELVKERKKMNQYFEHGLIGREQLESVNGYNLGNACAEPPYKVLDVGSCYNPLKKFEFLDVYPIDLCPASPEVKKCDFVDVQIGDVNSADWFNLDELHNIPCEFFDVVVFSLYLEYLPSPKQRYSSCEKAYNSLKANGLLLIVTPDSKHATANAHIMKSWKIAAASIGFNRSKLEKLKYLYCMAFRKSISPKYPALLNGIENNELETLAKDMFIIPQDSVNYQSKKSVPNEKYEKDERSLRETFNELPFS